MSIRPCGHSGAVLGLLAVILACITSTSQQDACSDMAVGFSAANPNCTMSSSCLEVKCSNAAWGETVLMVSNCKDPIGVQLLLTNTLQQCSRIYGVSGDAHYSEVGLDGKLLNVAYSRNASHLQFVATTAVGSADIFAIPAVDIPITPGQCMYDSFITASERLKLPKPLMESCVAETDYCGGVLCNLTLPGEVYESCITIEPCNQTLRIVITDSLNLHNTFERVFYNNESVVLHSSIFQIHLNVLLDHYNYSMEATVLMDIPPLLTGAPVLSKQRFILDRTNCNPFISYPAAPNMLATDMMCTGTTTTIPKKSLLVVEVTVPVVLLIISALVMVVVFLAMGLGYRHYKRKREFNFRRIAFEELHDDD